MGGGSLGASLSLDWRLSLGWRARPVALRTSWASLLATRERRVTQTISITSTQRSFRSSGTACEKEMQWTNGQKRHDVFSAGHEVVLMSFHTTAGLRNASAPMKNEYMALR